MYFYEYDNKIAETIKTNNLHNNIIHVEDKLGNSMDYFLIALDIKDTTHCFKLFNLTNGTLTEVEVAWFSQRKICLSKNYVALNKLIKVLEIKKIEKSNCKYKENLIMDCSTDKKNISIFLNQEDRILNQIKYLQETLCQNIPYGILRKNCKKLKKLIDSL